MIYVLIRVDHLYFAWMGIILNSQRFHLYQGVQMALSTLQVTRGMTFLAHKRIRSTKFSHTFISRWLTIFLIFKERCITYVYSRISILMVWLFFKQKNSQHQILSLWLTRIFIFQEQCIDYVYSRISIILSLWLTRIFIFQEQCIAYVYSRISIKWMSWFHI